jgi:hypothetical protein
MKPEIPAQPYPKRLRGSPLAQVGLELPSVPKLVQNVVEKNGG